MRSATKHVVFFLMVMVPIYRCQAESCVQPLPGKCSKSNYTIDDDEVCPLAKGGCTFGTAGEGLCDYRQGCKESVMTNWTAGNGSVAAKQIAAGSCSSAEFYYSVLESPWLEFTAVSCLKFQYSRKTPAALDVFLALHNGSVITILNRTQNGQNAAVANHTSTVQPGIINIKFRAYGGGANSGVNVYFVSVSPGDCAISGGKTTEASDTDTAAPGTTVSSAGNCRPLTTAATGTATTNQEDTSTQSGTAANASNRDTAAPDTSTLSVGNCTPLTSSTTTPPTASTTNQDTSSRKSSTSRKNNGNKTSIALIALAVVLSVVAVGLVVAVVVIVTLRRKITHLRSTADAIESRELGPGFDLRETSGAEVTDTTEDGDTTVPHNYDSPGDLSPPNDYTIIQDKIATFPAATETSSSYYNVDNRQTTDYYNTEGRHNNPEVSRSSYYNMRGQGSAER